MNKLELAVIDVETSGISAVYDRIIEVAVLRISKGELTEQSSTLVNPERAIPRYIERLTGITNEDLRGAPVFREIKDDLLRLLEGSILVAHNARFDYGFIRKEFERERIAFSAKCLCTVRLSRRLFPGYRRHNLDSIIRRFDLDCANRHRAIGDARVLWEFLRILRTGTDAGKLNEAVAMLLGTPAPPAPRVRLSPILLEVD
jgi:DNA polymerase-3 subunit epsilon